VALLGRMLGKKQQQQQNKFLCANRVLVLSHPTGQRMLPTELTAKCNSGYQLVKEDWQQQSLAEQERLDVLSAAINKTTSKLPVI